MPTPLLITRSDFTGRVELALNMVDAKINNRILEAEDFDLRELMGDAFYWSFIAQGTVDPVPQGYTDLLNGKSYTINSIDFTFYGIKPVLVYFATARLIKNLDLYFTPSGVMQKRNDFSDHMDPKYLSWRANQFSNQALAYWNLCVQFLDANKTTYPLWKPDCACERETGARPRVTGLGGGSPDPHEFPIIFRR